ncbi:hypothetical protein OIU76_001964 [Salix suchowensis]|nr:hypothetical protein OIU76_001964 [Salix suchowensis]
MCYSAMPPKLLYIVSLKLTVLKKVFLVKCYQPISNNYLRASFLGYLEFQNGNFSVSLSLRDCSVPSTPPELWKSGVIQASTSQTSVQSVSYSPNNSSDELRRKSSEAALILIRHGESLWNEKNLFTGCVDVPLTKKGCGGGN